MNMYGMKMVLTLRLSEYCGCYSQMNSLQPWNDISLMEDGYLVTDR
jgi:hypothetical protein